MFLTDIEKTDPGGTEQIFQHAANADVHLQGPGPDRLAADDLVDVEDHQRAVGMRHAGNRANVIVRDTSAMTIADMRQDNRGRIAADPLGEVGERNAALTVLGNMDDASTRTEKHTSELQSLMGNE